MNLLIVSARVALYSAINEEVRKLAQEVYFVQSYYEAIDVINSNDINILISDISIGSHSGIDLINYYMSANNRFNGFAIIMLSSLASAESITLATQSRAHKIIVETGNFADRLIDCIKDFYHPIASMRNQHEKDAWIRSIFTAMPDTILVIGHDLQCLYSTYNKSLILDPAREDLVGLSIHEFLPSVVADKIKKVIETVGKNRKLRAIICQVKERWYEIRITPCNGTGYMLLIRDISEGRKLRRRVEESEKQFESILDTSPDCIIVHENGLIIYANNKALVKLGAQNMDEILDLNIYQFIHPKDVELCKNTIDTLLDGSFNFTAPIRVKVVFDNNREELMEIVSSRARYNDRIVIQTILHDISAQIELENLLALQAMNKAFVQLEASNKVICEQLSIGESVASDGLSPLEKARLIGNKNNDCAGAIT